MKILIISHNPLCTYDNMGLSILSLMSGFDADQLCELYIYPSIPNVEKCSSYYRITDKSVLKSFFSFKVRGESIQPDSSKTSLFEKSYDELLYRSPKNNKKIRMIFRDIMWKFARWYNRDLKEWIREQKPDCIFAAPGVAKFLYDVAMTVSRDFKIPIVSYLCDEFYFVRKPYGLLNKVQVGLLMRKIEQYMSCTSGVISISEELTALYSDYFKKPVTTIMTGYSFPVSEKLYDNRNGIISFFGNVRFNRFISLIEIGKKLESTGFILEIHTSENDSIIINDMKSVPGIKLCPFVTGDEYVEAIRKSDYLLHVEAFDEDSMDKVKNSISTKIPDSLASGVPLIAYGPKDIASIKHLLRNDCAFVITERENLRGRLKEILSDPVGKGAVVRKALKVASEFHNPEINKIKVKAVFDAVVEEN